MMTAAAAAPNAANGLYAMDPPSPSKLSSPGSPSSLRPVINFPTTSRTSALLEPPPGVSFSEFVRGWQDGHISRWLSDIRCGLHASTFKTNDIRGEVILDLDQHTLKELGISSIGDRLRILNAVKSLRQRSSNRASVVYPPRVLINGATNEFTTSRTPDPDPPKYEKVEGSSGPKLAVRRLESGRPAPLQLAQITNRTDIQTVRTSELPPDSAKQVRPLPQPTNNRPQAIPPPRSQPNFPPPSRPPGSTQYAVSNPTLPRSERGTPTQSQYSNSPGTNALPWSGGYGLPSNPRPNAQPNPSLNTLPVRIASRNIIASPHTRTASLNNHENGLPKRRLAVNQSHHPYGSGLQIPPIQTGYNLSPINEGFSAGTGAASPPMPYSVGRGPFNRPSTPSHGMTPTLEDLRRRLVKFALPDEGHSSTINVTDCSGGVEILEKVLKKFGKYSPRSGDQDNSLDHVETSEGGLLVDGWGVFLDWGQEDGPGEPLTESELLSICHAPPDNPAREHGLTLRRIGKTGRSKPLVRESPTQNAFPPTTPTSSTPGTNILTPNRGGDGSGNHRGDMKSNVKRASSISILSGLGVRDPEKALDPPSPTTQTLSGGRASPATPPPKKPSKLRNFFGQRPPSELITNHLTEYFPFTEKRVLERTARHSILRHSTFVRGDGVGSAWSIAPPLPSRFSSSTQGSVGPMSPSKPSFSQAMTGKSDDGGQHLDTASIEDVPRVSLSTDDGRSVDLHDAQEDSINAEAEAESVRSIHHRHSRPVSRAISVASKPSTYITELRSKRDRSDTASLMTVDEITAEVESRRESFDVEREEDDPEEWTKVDTEEEDEIEDLKDTLPNSDGDDEDEDDKPGKAVATRGGASKWIKGALIGAGSFGKVYLGMDASNGLLMAVKQVELPTGSAPNQERKKSMLSALEREIELLKNLQHENIVQYLYSSLDADCLNIFLEYVPGGSVTALLRNYGAFEEPLVKNFVHQILEGLNYLHERDIIHRDIKGANILVDNKGGVKISDFGISKKVDDTLLTGNRMHRPSLQGSVFWMAPEVVKQTGHTRKADIWSVGCLVVEMLTGEHPWAQLTQMQAIFKIGSCAKPTIPSDISSEAQDFLSRTFDLDHEARPGASQLLAHEWIAKKKSKIPKEPKTANPDTGS